MQEDAAPRNLNCLSGHTVGFETGFSYSWSGLKSLSFFCPVLAVLNTLEIDMRAVVADVIRGFSCNIVYRLTCS